MSPYIPFSKVLIVAKCNVNAFGNIRENGTPEVLIVAKCNVNSGGWDYHIPEEAVLIVAKCNVNQQFIL